MREHRFSAERPKRGNETDKGTNNPLWRTAARTLLSAALACILVASPAVAADTAHAQTGAPAASTDASTDQRVVKVGYMQLEGVFKQNEDGSFEGYTYDYLMRIAQFTGWTYEFVEAEGETLNDRAANLVTMLQNGEVDLEGSMTYSAALGTQFEYPENSYGSAHTSLFAPNEDPTVSKTDLFTRDELRVAINSKASKRRAELEYFCEQNGINLTTVECTTNDELLGKTLSGEADAYLDIDINIEPGFHIIASFAERPYFFAAPLGERAIIDEVDATIKRINDSNPTLREQLYDKYFMKSETNFTLTDEEKAFSRQHETLRVGVLSEKAPLQTFDEQTGQLKGVTSGILAYLSSHAGLSFEVVQIERTDDIHAAVRAADVDMVAGINNNTAASELLGVSLTAPYMSTSIQLVYNKFINPDDLADKTIALPWELASTAPEGSEVLVLDSLEECLEAVDSGKADYTYGTSYTTPYYLNVDDLDNLLYLPMATQPVDVCFGIVQPIEPELLVVINKSLRDLGTAELDSIIYDNSLIDQNEQINLFVKDHLLEIAFGFISLLVLIIVLLMLYLRSRVRAARAVREENLRFQELYRLSNEQFFEYSIKSDVMRISKSKGLLKAFDDDAAESDGGDDSAYLTLGDARARIAESGSSELIEAFTSPAHAVTEVLCSTGGASARQWIRITSHFVLDDDGKPISVIGKIANIDEEMREKMDLSERAHHDGLTGLLNWKTFQEKAGALLVTGKAGALLIADADDFKSVNDTLGHLAGDRALQMTAEALVKAFRPHDLIGRLGGDEFAICIDGPVDRERLVQACADIVDSGVSFTDQNGVEHSVTLSMGGVILAGAAASYQEAYRRADKALYRAKAEGKDRYIVEDYPAE